MRELSIGLVGATGLVGQTFLSLFEQENIPLSSIRLFASNKRIGQKLPGFSGHLDIERLTPKAFANLDIVFFAADPSVSKKWGPIAEESGAWVVDNSSYFRDTHHLVIPSVNGHKVLEDFKKNRLHESLSEAHSHIVANPNCVAIPLCTVLNPLHKAFGLKSVQIATYQSVSGAGALGVKELLCQTSQSGGFDKVQNLSSETELSKTPYSKETVSETFSSTEKQNTDQKILKKEGMLHQNLSRKWDVMKPEFFSDIIFSNLIPYIGDLEENGFCDEEEKIIFETQKILGLKNLNITASVCRVPTVNVHAGYVWVELNQKIKKTDCVKILEECSDLILSHEFPTNRHAHSQAKIFLGRIRQNPHNPHQWIFWFTSDNLVRGAAYNAIQIARLLTQI